MRRLLIARVSCPVTTSASEALSLDIVRAQTAVQRCTIPRGYSSYHDTDEDSLRCRGVSRASVRLEYDALVISDRTRSKRASRLSRRTVQQGLLAAFLAIMPAAVDEMLELAVRRIQPVNSVAIGECPRLQDAVMSCRLTMCSVHNTPWVIVLHEQQPHDNA